MMVTSSCEKEQLPNAAAPSQEDAALVEAINLQTHGPAPAYESLAEIPIVLRDGALEFTDVVDFRRAFNTLGKASDDDYQAWARSVGFDSPYLHYLALHDKIETEQGPLNESILTVAEQRYLQIDEDGVPRFKVPYFELMKTISFEDAIFQVDATINYYTADRHYAIPERQYEVLEEIQVSPYADYSDQGVVVETIEVQRAAKGSTGEEKVQRAGFNCPVGLSNGESPNAIGISIRELIDNREISGNDQRLTSNLIFFNSLVVVASQRDVVQRLTVEYENEKRSWFTWIGTQPGLRFAQAVDLNDPMPQSDLPVADLITMSRNLRVFRTFNGGLAGFVTVLNENGPITEANSTTFTIEREDSRGSGLFDDFSFSYVQPLGVSETDFDLSYFMAHGSARAFWSGRDTRNNRDHVSADFNCN